MLRPQPKCGCRELRRVINYGPLNRPRVAGVAHLSARKRSYQFHQRWGATSEFHYRRRVQQILRTSQNAGIQARRRADTSQNASGHRRTLWKTRRTWIVLPTRRYGTMYGVLGITSSRVPGTRPGRPISGLLGSNVSTLRTIWSATRCAAAGSSCAMSARNAARSAIASGDQIGFMTSWAPASRSRFPRKRPNP